MSVEIHAIKLDAIRIDGGTCGRARKFIKSPHNLNADQREEAFKQVNARNKRERAAATAREEAAA